MSRLVSTLGLVILRVVIECRYFAVVSVVTQTLSSRGDKLFLST
jgi:hypothetical protein